MNSHEQYEFEVQKKKLKTCRTTEKRKKVVKSKTKAGSVLISLKRVLFFTSGSNSRSLPSQYGVNCDFAVSANNVQPAPSSAGDDFDDEWTDEDEEIVVGFCYIGP